MASEWSVNHLNKSSEPNLIFQNMFGHFANTQIGRDIVEKISQRISNVFPSFKVVSLAAVEHPEQHNDPGEKQVSGISFQIICDQKRNKQSISTLFVGQGGETASCFDYDYWKEVGHISIDQTELYHEFNSSTWQSDEFILDDVDEQYFDLMSELHNCLIEITDDQWIVSDEKYENFYFVNSSLVPLLLNTTSISEIFLRILYAKVFEKPFEEVFSKDFKFSSSTNENQVVIDFKIANFSSCSLVDDVDNLWAKYLRTDITSLDLSRNDFTVLPEEIKKFHELETLKLSSNKLTVLPSWITSFKKLKSLEVSSNSITELPKDIGNLTELINFNGIGNQLETLPDSFSRLKKLERINLYRNKLTNLPSSCSEFPELKFLELAYNKISKLDKPVKLEKLENLSVEGNPVEYIHDSFFSESLIKLTIKFTKLGFPGAISNCKNLESLHILSSGATEIPAGIFSLNKLSLLNLVNNEIEILPEEILEMASLDYLDLTGNNLETFPNLVKGTKLKCFYASKNKIKNCPDNLELPDSLKEVTLYKNNLTSFNCKFSETSEIRYIDLTENPLSEECKKELSPSKVFRV